MLKVTVKGNTKKTESFIRRSINTIKLERLTKYGEMGVEALSAATPVDTGLTAASWEYDIKENKNGLSIVWRNTNVVDGQPIAILLQYGHATRNGGYVTGIDYINPALKPVFEKMKKDIWLEVTE